MVKFVSAEANYVWHLPLIQLDLPISCSVEKTQTVRICCSPQMVNCSIPCCTNSTAF